MGDGEIMWAWVFLTGEKLGELFESKGSQNRHHVSVMTEIKVQALIQGECDRVVVERGVDLRSRVAKSVVLKTCYNLLDIT